MSETSNKIVIGVDSSTQSTKVEARLIETGEVVGVGRAPHRSTTPPRSEQDPADWWSALVSATGQLDIDRAAVVGVSIAGQQHGMVVLDGSDEVIRPAKLWNDTESAPQAQELVTEFGAEAWARSCGSVPVPAFTITKLAWLRAVEPDSFARIERVMLPHDWLTFRLTDRHVTDRGDASGTGWWSPAVGDYDDSLLDMVSLDPQCLPEVLGPLDPAGVIAASAADELGFPAATVVGPGSGDNMAAALGLGLRVTDVVISLGTSGTIYGVSEVPTADATGAVAGFADAAGRFLPLVCTLNATKVTDLIRTLLDLDHADFDALALGEPLGADGLVLLPYLDGERTPNRPDASGVLAGLRNTATRGQLARAAFEGVVHAMLDGLQALTAAGVNTDGRLFLVGGGAKSAAYRQIVADLSGREVIVPTDDEVVATGAAVQAAAIASGGSLDEVAAEWGLGSGSAVKPLNSDTALVKTLRASYGELRDRFDQ